MAVTPARSQSGLAADMSCGGPRAGPERRNAQNAACSKGQEGGGLSLACSRDAVTHHDDVVNSSVRWRAGCTAQCEQVGCARSVRTRSTATPVFASLSSTNECDMRGTFVADLLLLTCCIGCITREAFAHSQMAAH